MALSAELLLTLQQLKGVGSKTILKIAEQIVDDIISIEDLCSYWKGLKGKKFESITEDDIRNVIEKHYGKLTLCEEIRGNGPSVHYSLDGFKGKIGFISAVSHKFCDKCNRVRLTADGHLKTCLQFEAGVDLKPCLREGGTDKDLEAMLLKGISLKPKSHRFDEKDYFENREIRNMSQIGG